MNWFTKANATGVTLENKTKLVNIWGGCEHVEADPGTLYIVQYENDSFGREGHCLCEACYKEHEEAKGDEKVVCCDCKETVKQKDTIVWKWYDFYAPQGDEPLVICKPCCEKETHKTRVARDARNSEDEYRDDYY